MSTKREAILALADGTWTADEIVRLTGASRHYVNELASGRYRYEQRGPKVRNAHRDRAIIALRRCGATAQEIGAQFGITHQRVLKILSRGID